MLYGLLSAAGTVISVIIAVVAVGIVVMALVLHFVRKKTGQNGLRVRLLGLRRLHRLPAGKIGKKGRKMSASEREAPEKIRLYDL